MSSLSVMAGQPEIYKFLVALGQVTDSGESQTSKAISHAENLAYHRRKLEEICGCSVLRRRN